MVLPDAYKNSGLLVLVQWYLGYGIQSCTVLVPGTYRYIHGDAYAAGLRAERGGDLDSWTAPTMTPRTTGTAATTRTATGTSSAAARA